MINDDNFVNIKNSVALLRCPQSGQALNLSADANYLLCVDGKTRYPIKNGIFCLLPQDAQRCDDADENLQQ